MVGFRENAKRRFRIFVFLECKFYHGESLILMAARWDKLARVNVTISIFESIYSRFLGSYNEKRHVSNKQDTRHLRLRQVRFASQQVLLLGD